MPLNHRYYVRPDAPAPPPAPPAPRARQAAAVPFGAVMRAPTPPRGRRPAPRRKRLLLFCGTLLLLALLCAAGAVLVWRDGAGRLGAPGTINTTVPSPTPETTVARAPTGGDVTLALSPPDGLPVLSLQEIYRRNQASIVSVKGKKDDGIAVGTGVIFTADGYIVTNAHIIEGCAAVEIVLTDGRAYPAGLVGYDTELDLAVLKIDAAALPPALFGDSEALQVGDTALAIGNPLGERFRGTMTSGIISAMNRDVVVDGNKQTLIQTTAALNSGNSGGALLNDRGQVVGITSMKMTSRYDTIEGLGFAIPSATVKAAVDALIADGHIGGRPTIGITVLPLSPLGAAQNKVPQGVQISSVAPRSDAYAKGLRQGDIIVSANGTPIASGDALNAVKDTLDVGDVLALEVCWQGTLRRVEIVLVEKYTLQE